VVVTGRRQYEIYTDARKAKIPAWSSKADPAPVAWAYLPTFERAMWNEAARRITPKPKARS
jgi:hypothetical protein